MMPQMDQTFGDAFYAILRKSGMSGRTFAKLVGTTSSVVSQTMSDQIPPPKKIEDMTRWMEVIGVERGSPQWDQLWELYHLSRVPEAIRKEYMIQKRELEQLKILAKSQEDQINAMAKKLEQLART
jgi:transcriptional regulator with XRE-family HTH domain